MDAATRSGWCREQELYPAELDAWKRDAIGGVAVVVKSGGRVTHGENDGAWEAEFRIIWPDGSLHWLRLVGRADFASYGSLECTSGVLVDVTDRREAEDAVARLNRDLAAQVEEEIGRREAAQVRAAVSERMQALGQLGAASRMTSTTSCRASRVRPR